MTKITVVGAGMAGLLAGAMLRSDCEEIIEAQSAIPHNHSALLRFRSSVVGDVLGLEFKRVKVIKAVAPWRNSLADALAYSKKATGTYTLRSSLSAKGEMEERFIAPPDLIQKMADRVQAKIIFNQSFSLSMKLPDVMISTIPMPMLMKLLDYPNKDDVKFDYQHGCNINCNLVTVNAYGTLYIPDPDFPFSRVSLTGSRMTIEFSSIKADDIKPSSARWISQALSLLGIEMPPMGPSQIEVSDQKFAKILPIDETVRKKFIIWASEEYNIYSLGRFATWRTGLLLDDVVNDVRVIQRLLSSGHAYDHRKA